MGWETPPIATCADYPTDGDKRVPDLREALGKAGLRDGMVISTHHHFRNGDLVANQVFDLAAEMGVKDLSQATIQYPRWLNKLLTHPIDSLDCKKVNELLRTKTKGMIKVFC